MPVSFNTIPANLRVPLFYAEFDASQAGYFAQNKRTLLIGQKLAAGTAAAVTPLLVSSTDQAKTLFGPGSMLARMHAYYRLQDTAGEVWCIAAPDDSGGVAATGSITVVGTAATGAGALVVYVAGQRISVPVAVGDNKTAIATALGTAINANNDLPVTAATTGYSTGLVSLTARWKGITGNDITLVDNFRGLNGGESLPAGITLTLVQFASGAGNPNLSTSGVIGAMGDEQYDYVIHPYTDTTNLDALALELNDNTGRWSYARQVYGHAYAAYRGAASALTTFGAARNDAHCTIAGVEVDIPNPVWEFVAAYAGANALGLNADPARPTQTLPLNGILAPRPGKRFLFNERQSLLNAGIATSYVSGGVVRVERAITTYQKNAFSQADPSMLDSETMHQIAEITRRLRAAIITKYARHKLANDGTRYGAGQAIVTPSVLRGELIAEYSDMEDVGLVENASAFKKALILERDPANPNRVNALLPPDLINQLRIFALQNQFRLQYPAAA